MLAIAVPSSLKNLVEQDLTASRQFQSFLTAVKGHIDDLEKNVSKLQGDLTTANGKIVVMEKAIFPLNAMALLADGASVPANWKNVGTITIGSTDYQLIARSS